MVAIFPRGVLGWLYPLPCSLELYVLLGERCDIYNDIKVLHLVGTGMFHGKLDCWDSLVLWKSDLCQEYLLLGRGLPSWNTMKEQRLISKML